MKKVLAWVGLAIVVLYVINNPDQAAHLVHRAGHALATLTH